MVAMGHFFMSVIEAEIIGETDFCRWFIDSIYYFHVPLFFICSGYLYQKKGICSLAGWKYNIIKKFITLGIPYFVFTLVTWVMKEIFSGAVNSQNHALFFIFLVTPVFRSRKSALIGLLVAAIMKFVRITLCDAIEIYAVSIVCANGIWFVLGMCLVEVNILDKLCSRVQRTVGLCSAVLFLISSIAIYTMSLYSELVSMLMGMLGCASTILIVVSLGERENKIDIFSRYTMPVFLMHTIFAAGLRAILLKLGITTPTVHVVCGLTISFIGPIIAATIMEKIKMDIVIYPEKYIKISL